MNALAIPDVSAKTRLENLFTAVLQFRSDAPESSIIPDEVRDGDWIGSGNGSVSGRRLNGSLDWSLWAGNCLYPQIRKGQAVPAGLHLCTLNPAGFITTTDGARIRFEGRGFGLRSPAAYCVSMTMVFATEDARYEWLTRVLGVMEGLFDEAAGQAVWNVYVPSSAEA
jgi:hypothetical protein